MRIVCPGCAATYDVPDARLAPGRNVRCARCGTDWPPLAASEPAEDDPLPDVPELAAAEVHAAPDTPLDPTPEPPPDTKPDPVPSPAADPPPAPFPPLAPTVPWPRRGAVAAAWIASLVVLAGLAWGAYAGRMAVMQAWPPSERLYAALGLAG